MPDCGIVVFFVLFGKKSLTDRPFVRFELFFIQPRNSSIHHLKSLSDMQPAKKLFMLTALALATVIGVRANDMEVVGTISEIQLYDTDTPEISAPDSIFMEDITVEELPMSKPAKISIYELPASLTTKSNDWPRLWVNTGVLATAYIGTLVVLECLPEDATSWNRAEIQKDPWYTRWYNNVIKEGPAWDKDNPIFNYVLHPYAGAVYFMAARTCGFNFYQSLLYSACISTIGWEFGIEACMERPSIQDIFVTPLVGSLIGEGFYRLKRYIVHHDYHLFGSPVVGNIVAFLIDPVNEVVDLFRGNPERRLHLGKKQPEIVSSLMPTVSHGGFGFTFSCVF